ncbi:uncharacterized protein [Dermacentor albipictus]|uniref:uncharacterized protein isoform X2 n=1 Tax=Dermacentor albipictus TaxID=60249 RepID=UPI0038FC94BF
MEQLFGSPGSPLSPPVNSASPEVTEKDLRVDEKGTLQIVVSNRGHSAAEKRKLTPAEAVLAGEILFPDEEEPWYERSISLPRHFEGPSGQPTYVEVEDLSAPVFTYLVYGLFSGFLVVLILIAIVAYIISFAAPKSPSSQPLVLCYYDPTMSAAFTFTRSELCIECCSYFIYDGLEVDGQGNIKERTGTGPASALTISDWLQLKTAGKMKMLCGLRVELAPAFKDALDPRVKTIVDTLRSTYAGFDGAAFLWMAPETSQEIILYQALRSSLGRPKYKIIAHIARLLIDAYNFTDMIKYVDSIVINTHDFAVHGKAYPPCMYQSGSIIDVVDKNLVDVLNRILTLAPFLSTRLVPTVSTIGKKYVFEDANNVNVGDRVDLSKPPVDSPLFKFCQDRTAWTTKMDNKTKCDTAFNNMKEWIGFESPTSVAIKTELVKKKKLAGIAVLNIEQDGREACTGDKKPYLLGAVHRGLRVP